MDFLVVYASAECCCIVNVSSRNAVFAGELFELSGLRERFPELPQHPHLAASGRVLDWKDRMTPGARLDVLRPLIIDPMEVRRKRARRQDLRATTKSSR